MFAVIISIKTPSFSFSRKKQERYRFISVLHELRLRKASSFFFNFRYNTSSRVHCSRVGPSICSRDFVIYSLRLHVLQTLYKTSEIYGVSNI